MSINWVMQSGGTDFVRLNNERVIHAVRSRVAFEASTIAALQRVHPFSLKSDSGAAYVTSQRLIFIPSNPTEAFKSFSGPILNFQDMHLGSSLFGPYYLQGEVRPVSGGGIPADIPLVQVKLTFYEGGGPEFQSTFERIKERLNHAREIARETGQRIPGIIDDEPLPAYPGQPVSGSTAPGPSATMNTATDATRATQTANPVPAPTGPPPDYEEAQAQAVSNQFEDRQREGAERSFGQ